MGKLLISIFEKWYSKFKKLLKKLYKGSRIDIEIDIITPCLQDTKTGEYIETIYNQVEITKIRAKELRKQGWRFNWNKPQKNGFTIYELKLINSNVLQGLVAITDDIGFTWVKLTEAAPFNVGKNKKYDGVGGHLFAIACEDSFNKGNEGVVVFESKTKLVEYYKKKLDAKYTVFQLGM